MRLKISDKFLGKDADRDALRKNFSLHSRKAAYCRKRKEKEPSFWVGWIFLER